MKKVEKIETVSDYSGAIIVIIIAILLIIGNVEINPGPNHVTIEEISELLDRKLDLKLEGVTTALNNFNGIVTSIKKEMCNSKNMCEEVNKDINILKQENAELKERLRRIDFCNRKKNVVIFGIPRGAHETKESLFEEVAICFATYLNINVNELMIEDMYRVGGKTILCKFTSVITRDIIMKKKSQLRGTNIRIEEDFEKATRERRKLLIPYLIKARRDGRYAVLVKDKIRIEGNVFELENMQETDDSEQTEPSGSGPESENACVNIVDAGNDRRTKNPAPVTLNEDSAEENPAGGGRQRVAGLSGEERRTARASRTPTVSFRQEGAKRKNIEQVKEPVAGTNRNVYSVQEKGNKNIKTYFLRNTNGSNVYKGGNDFRYHQ